jgi:hypothetical protein
LAEPDVAAGFDFSHVRIDLFFHFETAAIQKDLPNEAISGWEV